jgi:UPF0716 protein FxsA
MFIRLFLLFTIVPLLELFLLLRIGGAIGALPTIGIVVGTGLLGAGLARREGVRAWDAVSTELAAGRVPGTELIHGLLVLVAGVLLVTPGVLTDGLGFALLTRPIRTRLIGWLRRRFAGRVEVGGVHVESISEGPFGFGRPPRDAGQEPGRASREDAPGRVIDL